MPRVVFFGYPVRGHTVPSLPVVAELARRGIEVDYYSTLAFRPLIESTGARFCAYPPSCECLLTTPMDAAEHMSRILVATEQMLPPSLAALEHRADLTLFDASAPWGGIAARGLRLPSVASITTFALNRTMLQMSKTPPPAAWPAQTFARLNNEYGANFSDHLDVLVPVADLKFVYTSRVFQPAGSFFDASYLFLGPSLHRRPRDGARARGAGARPLAYVSLGTIFNQDHVLLFQISEVLAARGWQVIVSLGNTATPGQLAWPEHVHAYPFVDQIGVLAQAQLFVTHGGMNSVSEALSYAVPMIVIPQAVDQHLVARRTANLGAAVVIEQDAVSIENLEAALARIDSARTTFDEAAVRLQRSFSEVVAVSDAVGQALGLIDQGECRG